MRAIDDNFKPPLTQAFNATPALLSDWAGPVSISGTASVVITTAAEIVPLPNGAGWVNQVPVTVRITANENNGPAFASISYSATGAQVIPLDTVATNPADVSITVRRA